MHNPTSPRRPAPRSPRTRTYLEALESRTLLSTSLLAPTITLAAGVISPADGSITFTATVTLPANQPLLTPGDSFYIELDKGGVGIDDTWVSHTGSSFTVTFTSQAPVSGAYHVSFTSQSSYYAGAVSPTLNLSPYFTPTTDFTFSTPVTTLRAGASLPVAVAFAKPFAGSLHVSTGTGFNATYPVNGTSSSLSIPMNIAALDTLSLQPLPAGASANSCPVFSRPITVSQPTVIDLLALYTPQLLSYDPPDSGFSSLYNEMMSQVADTNTAFINSNIPLTLRLVGMAPISYNESGSLSLDLARLSNPHDGYMDDVSALRDRFGADLTALFVSAPTFDQEAHFRLDGIAKELLNPQAPNRAEQSYLVVSNALYILAHEVGHTLGAAHASDDPNPSGATPYAHGYRFTGNDGVQYRDIMAYEPGTQIPFFSNPDVTYQGVPLGNASTANASRVIRDNAPIVAAYRNPAAPFGALESSDGYSISGWALDPKILFAGAQLQIAVDGKTVATLAADQTRNDLEGYFGSANHGYSYTLPPLSPGAHVVSVFALDSETGRRTLIGKRSISAPTPLFDAQWYLAKYPDIASLAKAGTMTAWDHYRLIGQFELRSPSSFFDPRYYLYKNPDIAAAWAAKKIASPWAHYLAAGQYVNRVASPWFDPHFYRLANPDLNSALTKGTIKSLVNHFLAFGQFEGRNPIPYFNTADYKATLAANNITTPLPPYQHFLNYGISNNLSPSTWFNPATYLQLNPTVSYLIAIQNYANPLDHYLRVGKAAGLQFSTAYSESAYLAHNPDIAAAVAQGAFTSGFEHFVLWGYKEGRTAT